MADKLLDNASFALIRTNPKLTSNVKVTYTSDSKLYLNSIDASFELSKSDFKNFETSSTSDYHWDLFRFWKKGITPNNITHGLGDVADPTQIQSNFSDQYDLTYAAGAKYENARYYSEEFSYFAPLWLNSTIPEKFVIFRVDNPSSLEQSGVSETDEDTQNMLNDPSKFKEFILDNSTIVKTVDLGPESELGKYIRRYTSQNDFPTEPLNIRYSKEDFCFFNGISLNKGDFIQVSEKMHTNLVARDQTVIEFDNHISKGFERNKLAMANIMNLEFLFDDPEATDFSINRYYGFYVNTVSEGETTALNLEAIDDQRTRVSLTNMIYENADIADLASIYYIKDKSDKYYKIDSDSNWDSNSIVINEKLGKDDTGLLGFSDPVFTAAASTLEFKGHAYIEMEVTENPRSGDFYFLGGNSEEFQIVSDHNILKAGTNYNNRYSIYGSNDDVALSISRAINYNFEKNELIRATTRGNIVIVYSVFPGSRYNSRTVSRRTDIFNNVIKLTDNEGSFFGGSDEADNRVAIDISFLDTINEEPHFVDTSGGYKQVTPLRLLSYPIKDTDGTIIDFYGDDTQIVVEVEIGNKILINNFGNVNFYTFNKNEYGFFSIFPVKDFDFDFHSTEYGSVDNSQMIDVYNNLEYKQAIIGSTNLSDTSSENYGNLLKYDFDNTFVKFGNFTSLLGLELPNGELSRVDSEYDRLQENLNKDLSTYSRLSPFVTKWVKSGMNIKELPYRLNTNYAFGLDNFSPSFEIKTPNPQYFTHEWYYLGAYPEYVDKSNESIKNYYQFFDTNFDLDLYLDPNEDYFTSYFTTEEKGDFFINPEFKFSSVRKGSRFNFGQTFFRGVKLYVKKRRENETRLDFNVDNLDFIRSEEYNDYKFSAVLQPTNHFYAMNYTSVSGKAEVNGQGLPLDNPGESIPKIKYTVIENKKFKNITFLIEFKLPESNLYKFYFDTIFLYTYKSVKLIKFLNPGSYNNFNDQEDFLNAIEAGDFEFVYPDTPLTSVYDIRSERKDNRYQGKKYEDSRKVVGIRSIQETNTAALKEMTLNTQGKRNTIRLYNKGIENHIWEIRDILKVVNDRIILANDIGSDVFLYEDQDNKIDYSNFTALNYYPYYENGGFDFFKRQIEDASFANIFELVNQGSPEVEYVTIPEDFDGTTAYEDLERNNFTIEFEEPFKIQKSKYLTVTEDTDVPPGLTTETSIGYSLLREQGELLPMNRYGGDFFPKFKDILFFTDKNSSIEDLKNLNREFDIENPDFGFIKNFYYSKVSPEAFSRILSVNPETGFNSKYPLIGEIGIDKKDFYVFKSNWDLGYYQKNVNKTFIQSKFGTWNTLEQKNFLSSKILKIPEKIRIEEFLSKDITDTQTIDYNIEYSQPTASQIQMNVLLESKIIEKLFELGIAEIFDKYVNYEYTIQGNRIDFISDYIRLNVLPRYLIDEVIFWVNSSVGTMALPLVYNDIEDVEKIQLGYVQENTFNYNTLRNSNFNFLLTGALNTSKYLNFSTAITVTIVKR